PLSPSTRAFVRLSFGPVLVGSEPAPRPVAMTVMVGRMLMIPLAMARADAGGKQAERHLLLRLGVTLKRRARSPLLIAITLGLLLAVFQIPLPGVALEVVDMLAMAAAPVALFAVGGNLQGLRPKGMLADAGIITFGKLVLHPALTALAFM